jgi:outer membrane protein OmpA-like peptidoglycan-associated protein
MKKLILASIVLFSLLSQSLAQEKPEITKENNYSNYLSIGKDLYYQEKFNKAIPYFETLLQTEANQDNITVKFYLAECYRHERLYYKAQTLYKEVTEKAPEKYPISYVWIGKMYNSMDRYEQAIITYADFIADNYKIDTDQDRMLTQLIENSEFSLKQANMPNNFYRNLKILDRNINKNYSNYGASLAGKKLYFTGTITKPRKDEIDLPDIDAKFKQLQIDRIFYAHMEGSQITWQERELTSLKPPKNNNSHMFAPFFDTKNKVLYFTIADKDNYNNGVIYKSIYNDGDFSAPKQITFPADFDASSIKHPMIANTGNNKIIFFAANPSQSKGEFDIFYGLLSNAGTVTDIQSVGDNVNTSKDEISPFYNVDEQILYFSSKGHKGMGNYDIFYVKGEPYKEWQIVTNIRVPVNSGADDYFYTQYKSGDNYAGYFASNRVNSSAPVQSTAYDKIYHYEKILSKKDVILTGKVYDASSKAPIPNARIRVINSATNESIVATTTNNNGKYEIDLAHQDEIKYDIEINAEGYMFFNKTLRFINGKYVPMETLLIKNDDDKKDNNINIVNFPLNKLQVGNKIILKNIYFDFNTASLKSASYAKLVRLSEYMKQNPKIKVEISGHTDNIGSFDYNMKLSKERAKTVVSYLRSNGIDQGRMKYQGYSWTKPIATNSTEEGRQMNRRVEFKIIGIDK